MGWRRHAEDADEPDAPVASGPTEEGAETQSSKLDEQLLGRMAQPTLPAIERPAVAPSDPPAPSLRMARITKMTETSVELLVRGRAQPVAAQLDEGVDRE